MTLTELTSGFFDYLVVFRRKLAEKVPQEPETVAAELDRLFEDMDEKADGESRLGRRYREIRKTLTIIADDIVIGSGWSGASAYAMRHLLENRHYQTATGGTTFWRELDNLAGADTDRREIYFTALALGFRGMHRNDPEKCSVKKKDLYESLGERTTAGGDKIVPEAYEVDERDCTVPPVARLGRFAVVLLGLILFLWLLDDLIYSSQMAEITGAWERLTEGMGGG